MKTSISHPMPHSPPVMIFATPSPMSPSQIRSYRKSVRIVAVPRSFLSGPNCDQLLGVVQILDELREFSGARFSLDVPFRIVGANT